MEKQEFKTVLENEYVNRVRKDDAMIEIVEGFNMSVLKGDKNIGNISYSKGGYIHCSFNTNLSPEYVKKIIKEIAESVKVDVIKQEPIGGAETEQLQ